MISDSLIQDESSFLQPKALYILFFVELWERFSYYGIRVLLIFYMTSELHYNDVSSYGMYGMYFTLIYASAVIGGYLADQYLGNLKAIYLGAIFIIAGHICLTFPLKELFSWGLSFIIAGTGFFKANITSFLGQYYENNDPRRDSGFTIFYSGINIGAFFAPLICGYVGREYGWNYGFCIAGLGMLLAISALYLGRNILGDKGQSPNDVELHRNKFLGLSQYHLIILGSLISIPVFSWCVNNHEIMGNFLNAFGLLTMITLGVTVIKCKAEERKAILTLVCMLPFCIAFFASFEQVGASMSLFIDRHVDRHFLGYEIPTTWFQSLTPFFIIILSPLFSKGWIALAKHRKEPLTPLKFALALFQIGLSFWLLTLAVHQASTLGYASLGFLILAYFFRTSGELCISPVSLSMVTKLAPKRFASFMMGVLFLSLSFAQFAAQQIAKHFTVAPDIKVVTKIIDKSVSLMAFGDTFQFLIYLPVCAGIFMLVISPFLKDIFKRHN